MTIRMQLSLLMADYRRALERVKDAADVLEDAHLAAQQAGVAAESRRLIEQVNTLYFDLARMCSYLSEVTPDD